VPSADLTGVRLHYEVEGEGPPLLLLAGMMSDSASWGPLVPLLAPAFTVIRPDNRTTGRTLPAEAPAGLARWAGDAVALLEHLGFPRAHVVGHSLGGLIALHMAAAVPARVGRLALLAAAPVRVPRTHAILRHLLSLRAEGMAPDLWLRGLFPWLFHPRLFHNPAAVDTMVAQSLAYPHAQGAAAMARQLDALEQSQARLALLEPPPPTLAILGADDLLLPPAIARQALAPLAPSRIVEIVEAGHSVHWDAPEAVAHHLLLHLAEGA
jgi:pimeloyl-ACP methyl ester carboxylesterase